MLSFMQQLLLSVIKIRNKVAVKKKTINLIKNLEYQRLIRVEEVTLVIRRIEVLKRKRKENNSISSSSNRIYSEILVS